MSTCGWSISVRSPPVRPWKYVAWLILIVWSKSRCWRSWTQAAYGRDKGRKAHTGFTRHWFSLRSDPYTRLWVVSLNARDAHIGYHRQGRTRGACLGPRGATHRDL